MNNNVSLYDWETITIEGKARIIIPNLELFKRPNGIYEPSWAPVFYNPRMKFSRDIAVVVSITYFDDKEYFYIEPLAGSGVRSIRYSLETRGRGIANDLDPIAYYYIKRNIRLNNVGDRVEAYNSEANTLLNSIRTNGIVVDLIDVDPYGSPIPFIDSTVYAIARNGLIAITATDTGPLNCSYEEACYRRYHAKCYKVDFVKEMGLRILLGSIILRAASHDVLLKPILSYYHDYYYRAYFTAIKSANEANKALKKNIGYILYCADNYYREYIPATNIESMIGEKICEKQIVIGPLWIGLLGEREFIEKILFTLKKKSEELKHILHIKKFLSNLSKEISINNPYYRYDLFCGYLKMNMPPRDKLINELRNRGFKAIKSHFDPRGIKTNASYEEFISILRSLR